MKKIDAEWNWTFILYLRTLHHKAVEAIRSSYRYIDMNTA